MQCEQYRTHPDDNNDRRGDVASRPVPLGVQERRRATFLHYFARNEAAGEPDSQRNYDQVVNIAEHRYEIEDQVDRAQRIRDDESRYHLRVPGHARIATSEDRARGPRSRGA